MTQAQTTESTRSGQYVRQIEGYRAFIPKPLPPDPEINVDGEMYALISKADRALGRLDGSIQTLPNPELFVLMYVRKEAVLSSQIEGTQSSINDVLEVEAKVFDSESRKDVREVLNYINAMYHGLGRLEEIPLSVRLIREIHEKLMRGVRGKERQPGQIRTSQNWIGPQGCTINEAAFVPPPPSEVPRCLSDLEKFYHDDPEQMPALVQIGLAHAQFETIHPFLDGNGRVGRLLITFMLCQRQILIRPVLYISHYFRRNQQKYYDLLQSTRDSGDWESWLRFFLNGVAMVSNEATETARQIVEMREQHRGLIQQEFGRAAGNALNVLEYLFQQPIVKINDIKELLDITHSGASGLTHRLVHAGLLFEVPGRARNRLFRYEPYIRLFTDS